MAEDSFKMRMRKITAGVIALIKNQVTEGSVVQTDEFSTYKALSSRDFVHQTVNPFVNYVDPVSGAHIQGIKRMWLDLKGCYKRSGVWRRLFAS